VVRAHPEKPAEAKPAEAPKETAWTPVHAQAAAERTEKAQHEGAQEAVASQHADEAEAKEQGKELHEHGEKASQLKKAQGRPGERPAGRTPQPGAQKKPGRDGFERLNARSAALTSGSYASLNPVGAVPTNPAAPAARAERPPDAFTLLKQAKEKGVLFQEDSQREGHSEDQEDPALAEAVEEAIRLLFGVRGVLRIGPGRNEADEPVVVVVAAQGFSEASFARVPPEVHGFATLVAIPFDLLPLRKER